MGRKSIFNVDQLKEMVCAYAAGDKLETIALRFGIDPSCVSYHARLAGLPPRGRSPVTEEQRSRIARLITEGVKYVAIAHDCGTSPSGVQRIAAKMGVSRAPGPKPRRRENRGTV
jgi:DNA invertase Pin-like site-specific DNA recombinase